jgi:hypothetical protein
MKTIINIFCCPIHVTSLAVHTGYRTASHWRKQSVRFLRGFICLRQFCMHAFLLAASTCAWKNALGFEQGINAEPFGEGDRQLFLPSCYIVKSSKTVLVAIVKPLHDGDNGKSRFLIYHRDFRKEGVPFSYWACCRHALFSHAK